MLSSDRIEIAPCSYEAAKHAVLHWHYSKTMPIGRLVKYGCWEDGKFVGAVLYGRGASPHLGDRFGVGITEVSELVRVAFREHETPITFVIARTLRMLRESNPGLRVVVSFADSREGHIGKIYQAGNWTYLGNTAEQRNREYFYRGKWRHNRQLQGTSLAMPKEIVEQGITFAELRNSLPQRLDSIKWRYAYPLDRKMGRLLRTMALPYPGDEELHAAQVSEEQTPIYPVGEPGAIPGSRSRTNEET